MKAMWKTIRKVLLMALCVLCLILPASAEEAAEEHILKEGDVCQLNSWITGFDPENHAEEADIPVGALLKVSAVEVPEGAHYAIAYVSWQENGMTRTAGCYLDALQCNSDLMPDVQMLETIVYTAPDGTVYEILACDYLKFLPECYADRSQAAIPFNDALTAAFDILRDLYGVPVEDAVVLPIFFGYTQDGYMDMDYFRFDFYTKTEGEYAYELAIANDGTPVYYQGPGEGNG